MNKEQLINKVLNEINSSWNIDQIIRYVYLEVGKYLKKDIKFFYTLAHKGEQEDLYEYDELKQRYEECVSLTVICKSALIILQEILNKLNIKSRIIETTSVIHYKDPLTGQELDVKHFFLSVTGEENKEYFLTIIPDLARIQLGMSTEHFGNEITYNINGRQMYEGDPINNYIFTQEELEALDLSINANNTKIEIGRKVKNMYVDDIIEYLNHKYTNNEYMSLLSTQTEIYKKAMTFNLTNGEKVSFNDFEDCRCVNFFDMNNEEWKSWLNTLKKVIDEELLKNQSLCTKEILSDYNALTKTIEKIDYKKIISMSQEEQKSYFFKQRRAINKLIEKISLGFVDNSLKYDWKNDKYASAEYIANKLEKMFPTVMGEGKDSLTSKVNGFAEQLLIIDFVIEKLFKELKHESLPPNIKADIEKNQYIVYYKGILFN